MVKNKDLQKKPTSDSFATEKVNVISNCLLGNYIDDQYVISDEIKDELIEAVKVKKSVFKNSVFCGAFLQNYGELLFEVTFQKNTVKNIAMAELFVLENEQKVNGYIQNTIRTKIGEYIDALENFIEKTYKHFNILLTEDNGRDYNLDEDISIEAYIGAKRNFNINMAKLTQRDYNKLYREYVTKRLEVLKKLNTPYSQAILEKFNDEYAKIEKYFLQDNNYKSVSELLDKCIDDCTGINPQFAEQEKELMKEMSPIVEEFTKQAEEIAEKAHPKALENLNKNDRERVEEMEMQEHQARESAPVPTKPIPERTKDTASPAPSQQQKPSTPEKQNQQPKTPVSNNATKSEHERPLIRGGAGVSPREFEKTFNEYKERSSQPPVDKKPVNANSGIKVEHAVLRYPAGKNPEVRVEEKSTPTPQDNNAVKERFKDALYGGNVNIQPEKQTNTNQLGKVTVVPVVPEKEGM